MFLVNSRLSHFAAAPIRSESPSFASGSLHRPEHPFFRSYGANWSSSLRGVLPSALECSSRPPVSVYGTVTCSLARGFSWRYGIRRSALSEDFSVPSRLGLVRSGFAWTAAYTLRLSMPTDSRRILPRHPIAQNGREVVQESLRLFSIAYAFRPRLRIRLTPGGVTWPGNPWTFGGQDSHLSFRY